MRWQPSKPTCDECGYSWAIPLAQALDIVTDTPAQVATALDRAGAAATAVPAPDTWSASGYAWHLVDVFRIGTERLWSIVDDPGRALPAWDENALADARSYARLSPVVAPRALRDAAATWLAAARRTPEDAAARHESDGTLTAGDVIRRNAHEARHHLRDIARVTPP
jgi:hypothetical protein